MRPQARWAVVAAGLSGAAALGYEATFLRRLSVVVGGSAVASSLTLAAYMLGLGLGGALAGRRRIARPARAYAVLELLAVATVVAFPWVLPFVPGLAGAALVVPTAMLLGATWPVLVRGLRAPEAVAVYAANTAGAVAGVLLTTFVTLPSLGVRGAEVASMALGVVAATLAISTEAAVSDPPRSTGRPPRLLHGLLAAATGFTSLGLEVVWMRLASVGLGATVQTIGLVLAVFLAMLALGSLAGRTVPADPRAGAWIGAAALAVLALVGGFTFPLVPYGVAFAYDVLGPDGLFVGHVVLAALWMGGAPLASGFTFSALVRASARETTVGESASWMYALNTFGSMAGSLVVGLWMLPVLEPRTTLIVLSSGLAGLAVLGAYREGVGRRPTLLLAGTVVLATLFTPRWDARLYAVGVHLAISDFATRDVASIRSYADGDWELLSYDHGWTAAVAVGRSQRTGNVWLSINGKFDASTGDDMPTQELSGELPVALSPDPRRVGVVGLASGVTAGAVLRSSRVETLDLFELEPAVVSASHFFDHVNGRPLDDPRTTLHVEDARAALLRGGPPYDVLISEPSNPWITGVSSLFTEEYWRIARSRLAPDGVFCQWVQLYGLGPDAFRGLVRTFVAVFGDVWLYETIEGSDVLLIAGPPPPPGSPYVPRLGPDGVRRLAGFGWLNTDDHPRIEWEAPRWLHYATAADNSAAIDAAARATAPPARPPR
jgi:predicted membrane-bound spermidine synthase